MQLTDFEVLTALIAAGCHDVHHPGNKNDFEAKLSTTLAVIYNDQSILENYHLAVTFSVLKDERYNIMETFTAVQKVNFRRQMIAYILGTDVTFHGV